MLDGNDHGHAAAGAVLAAHQVAGTLGRDHADVDVGRWLDVAESDVEAVPEEERLAGGQVRFDLGGVERALHVVGGQDHDDVSLGRGRGWRDDPQAVGLGLGPAARSLAQTDPHVDAGVAQVLRVGVALTAVADHSHLLGGDDRKIGVVFVEQLGHGCSFLRHFRALRAGQNGTRIYRVPWVSGDRGMGGGRRYSSC